VILKNTEGLVHTNMVKLFGNTNHASNLEAINLHIHPSFFEHGSRILKETKSIVDYGFADKVFILAIWKEGLLECEHLDAQRRVLRIRLMIGTPESRGMVKILRILEWSIRIFWAFRKSNVVLINCHTLTVLHLGFFFKLIWGSVLVYNPHELETESVGSKGIRQVFARLLEKTLIIFADIVINVNRSIADWYTIEYRLNNVYSVRNIPYQNFNDRGVNTHVSLRDKFSIGKDCLLFIYQGGLEYGRGIEILLSLFSEMDCTKHIVFMGMGSLDVIVKEFEERFPNIHFHPAVRPQEVHLYTRDCDVGISLIENVCLSYYLSLPNKLFEYIMSGLPVIVSDFPEMTAVVNQGRCGWTVPVEKEAVFSLISGLSKDDVDEKRSNALEYRKTLGWHNEEKVIVSALRNVLHPNEHSKPEM